MRYTFDVTIFDYMLQEKHIKLSSNHVIPLPEQLKSMHIVIDIISILMLLMITIFFIDRFNHP
jgi:hypothetical protein